MITLFNIAVEYANYTDIEWQVYINTARTREVCLGGRELQRGGPVSKFRKNNAKRMCELFKYCTIRKNCEMIFASMCETQVTPMQKNCELWRFAPLFATRYLGDSRFFDRFFLPLVPPLFQGDGDIFRSRLLVNFRVFCDTLPRGLSFFWSFLSPPCPTPLPRGWGHFSESIFDQKKCQTPLVASKKVRFSRFLRHATSGTVVFLVVFFTPLSIA